MQKLIPKNWMLVCGFGYWVTKSDITDLDIADPPASKDVLDKIKEACQNCGVTPTVLSCTGATLIKKESIFFNY
jgi:hypothetical protein